MAICEGGCFCGAVRYRAEGEGLDRTMCHCESCRRMSGAPAVAWASFPADRFAWVSGEPKQFRSSAAVVRTFCPSCGSSLTYQRLAHEIDVAVGTMDHPESFPPDDHTWTVERLSWFEVRDDRPRFARNRSVP